MAESFLFRFPMYVLAVDYSYNEETKDLILDDKIRFAAPEYGGKNSIALFTDQAAALEFNENVLGGAARDFSLSPDWLAEVLEFLAPRFEQVVIDPYHKGHRSKAARLPEFLSALRHYLDHGPSTQLDYLPED
jgi:hypothetical protein